MEDPFSGTSTTRREVAIRTKACASPFNDNTAKTLMAYTPFVSVVIPTFNRLQKLTAALDSVFAQSYSSFEVIIVDDGSTDGTRQHIEKLVSARSGGPSLRYVFQSNQGSSVARNRGIAEAGGEWIAFLDSDDLWFPEKLQWQVRAIEAYKAVSGACITDARLVNDSGLETTSFRETGRTYTQEIGLAESTVERLAWTFDHFWVTSLLVRSDLARQITGFDPNIQFCEDHDFNFRLSLVTSYCYVNKVLVQLDRSPAPSTIRPWEKAEVRLQNKQRMLQKWLKENALAPEIRKIILRNLRQSHSAWANWYLDAGRYQDARKSLSAAMAIEPTAALTIKWMLTRIAPSLARKLTPRAKAYTA
jgi:glycosyltransferase involved in cell wall biosynthesis